MSKIVCLSQVSNPRLMGPLKILEDAGLTPVMTPTGEAMPYPKKFAPMIQDATCFIASCEDFTTDEAFDLLPNLKLIVRFGAGMESVNLEAATRHGVAVCNAPGLNSFSVAEHALALMLSLLREISFQDRETREGRWHANITRALQGTIGLIGFGNIPRCYAKILQNFPVEVIAYDKYMDEEKAKELGVRSVDLDTLYRESDFISIHVPLLADTADMINDESIAKMKDGVYLVNTSRGGMIDEDALYRALKSGKIAAAGLDVLKREPLAPDEKLVGLPNTIITPHAAYGSDAAFIAVLESCCYSCVEFMRGEKPRFIWNPEVLTKR